MSTETKVEYSLTSNGRTATPIATAVIDPMDEGDILIGVRPHGAHPDSEYAIVNIAVEDDGTILVCVMDGQGESLSETKVAP